MGAEEAVLQFAHLSGGDPTTAVGLELNLIAAVLLDYWRRRTTED